VSSEEQGSRRGGLTQEGHKARSVVYDWEGTMVIVHYTGGPFGDDEYDLGVGDLRSESGVFLLREVSAIGVLAEKLEKGGGEEAEDELSGLIRFFPWGSINSLIPLRIKPPDQG
jgi:hypothetical protein